MYNVDIMDALAIEDLNGTNYLGLEEGETLRAVNTNTVYIPHGMAQAANPLEKPNVTIAHARSFLRHNAARLHAADNTIPIPAAVIIAFHRLLAIFAGLISLAFRAADYYVDYTEVVQMTDADTNADPGVTLDQVQLALPNAVKQRIRETFTDRVCIVAFVFRARGHHWTELLEELYTRVWRKTRHGDALEHISFRHLAREALHAIYPIVLDRFWMWTVQESRTNGALAKRIDVAPAGFAGPYILMQGLMDLEMVAPGIKHHVVEAYAYLQEILTWAKEHRWNGSVNARYYGARRGNVEEKRLGAIAATIKAAIDTLTDKAPLGKSPALTRIATNAPITGAVLGRAIGQVSNRPEVVNTLLLH